MTKYFETALKSDKFRRYAFGNKKKSRELFPYPFNTTIKD